MPGSFAYTPTNGAVLGRGTNTLAVIFTPADTVDYTSVTTTVSLVVSPAPLTVTAANESRTYGQANPVFTGTITGVTNGDNITATYSCSATNNSPVGTYPIMPALVDPDNRETNYAVTLVNGTLTVTQSPTVITWTNPAPIIYGASLSTNQLNATANVPGSFRTLPTNGASWIRAPTRCQSFSPGRHGRLQQCYRQREPGRFSRPLDRDGVQCEPRFWPTQPSLHGHHHWRDEWGQYHGRLTVAAQPTTVPRESIPSCRV